MYVYIWEGKVHVILLNMRLVGFLDFAVFSFMHIVNSLDTTVYMSCLWTVKPPSEIAHLSTHFYVDCMCVSLKMCMQYCGHLFIHAVLQSRVKFVVERMWIALQIARKCFVCFKTL